MDARRLADAIDRAVDRDGPLFVGADGARQTRALMVAVAWRESSFRLDVVGDQGRSMCAFQILNGPRSLLADVDACTTRGLAMMRESFAACSTLPVAERLAGYARGSCTRDDGRAISRDRFWVARDVERRTR